MKSGRKPGSVPPNKRIFTYEEEMQIVAWYEAGYSSVWIGKQIDFWVGGVTSILKKHGAWIRSSRNWTDEEEVKIAQEYLGGKSTRQIARERGVDKIGIIGALRRQGIEQRGPAARNRLYALNPYVFDVIDNEWAAYHWGFLWADGYVHKRSLTVSLKEADVDVLERMKNFLESESPIRIKSEKLNEKMYGKCRIEFTDRHLSSRLNELGIITGRPSIQPILDYLPSYLYHHWIRGFMDGDGTIRIKKNNQGLIGFCGDVSILAFIRAVLAEYAATNPDRTITKHIKANLYYLNYNGNAQCVRIRDFLYQDATIWMERKRERANLIYTR